MARFFRRRHAATASHNIKPPMMIETYCANAITAQTRQQDTGRERAIVAQTATRRLDDFGIDAIDPAY
jgi:hypothetical protein